MQPEPAVVVVRRKAKDTKVMCVLFGVLTAAVLLILVLSQAGIIRNQLTPFGRVAAAAAAVAAYGILVADCLRSRVTLDRDQITVTRGLMPTRTIQRRDVIARRITGYPGGPHSPILILKDEREIMLPPYLESNPHLTAWLRQLTYRRSQRGSILYNRVSRLLSRRLHDRNM